jgi:hypothetical protein
MSSDTLVVFYGLRLEVQPNEVEALKNRTDARVLTAQKVGLTHYLPSSAVPGEKSFLFVGAQLALLGPGKRPEVALSWRDLQRIAESTRKKLNAAGLPGEPALYVQWKPAG